MSHVSDVDADRYPNVQDENQPPTSVRPGMVYYGSFDQLSYDCNVYARHMHGCELKIARRDSTRIEIVCAHPDQDSGGKCSYRVVAKPNIELGEEKLTDVLDIAGERVLGSRKPWSCVHHSCDNTKGGRKRARPGRFADKFDPVVRTWRPMLNGRRGQTRQLQEMSEQNVSSTPLTKYQAKGIVGRRLDKQFAPEVALVKDLRIVSSYMEALQQADPEGVYILDTSGINTRRQPSHTISDDLGPQDSEDVLSDQESHVRSGDSTGGHHSRRVNPPRAARARCAGANANGLPVGGGGAIDRERGEKMLELRARVFLDKLGMSKVMYVYICVRVLLVRVPCV